MRRFQLPILTAACAVALFGCDSPDEAPPTTEEETTGDLETDEAQQAVDDGEQNQEEGPLVSPFEDDDFIRIEAGTFLMGAPEGDKRAHEGEHPQHEVTLSRDFLLLKTPVTQAQMEALDRARESAYDPCPDCAADNVAWYHAIAFANTLSDAEGLERCYLRDGTVIDGESVYECTGYRLPTEAEWEYAYRAGTETPFYWGDSTEPTELEDYAWYNWNSGGHTQPVAQKAPNPWGLYDMAGNVEEWTHDAPSPYGADAVTDPGGAAEEDHEHRVLRGGSATRSARHMRASSRHVSPFTIGNSHSFPSGFRLARTIDDQE